MVPKTSGISLAEYKGLGPICGPIRLGEFSRVPDGFDEYLGEFNGVTGWAGLATFRVGDVSFVVGSVEVDAVPAAGLEVG